jgi:hypothetical protein
MKKTDRCVYICMGTCLRPARSNESGSAPAGIHSGISNALKRARTVQPAAGGSDAQRGTWNRSVLSWDSNP